MTPATPTTCTSCGRTGESTWSVHRVHLVLPDGAPSGPDSIEELAEVRVLEPVETWCATCRESFPHVLAR
ncbi:MAG: hypothetical protein JST64_05230 [Actinobacteria bacterium]|nr:hypothetical protein [Actinomycetota bacterium]